MVYIRMVYIRTVYIHMVYIHIDYIDIVYTDIVFIHIVIWKLSVCEYVCLFVTKQVFEVPMQLKRKGLILINFK